MNKLPLSDQLPYQFLAPSLDPLCLWYARRTARSMLRRDHRVEAFDIDGLSHLRPLLGQGDAVLLTPNHTDHADSHVMFELSRRLGLPFYYMAAYQIFVGKERWFLPRIGAFPVDREGADLKAFKTGVDLLAKAKNPLVIFPEGEIYHLNDRLTPLREGAIAVAATAVKRLANPAKTVWIVPVALKYRYLDNHDPTPALHALMDDLERRATWWLQRHLSLVDRIYHYAQGMLCLKEYEYLGEPQRGPLADRLASLRDFILNRVEASRVPEKSRRSEALSVPERIKQARRACLDCLADEKTTLDEAAAVRKDLHDVFVAAQLYCYPGDYIRDCPTLERAAETLMKFEEDFLGVHIVKPRGPRKAVLRIGKPINVRAALAAAGKPRHAIPAITSDLESRIQSLLDAIGPGRPLEACTPPKLPSAPNLEANHP